MSSISSSIYTGTSFDGTIKDSSSYNTTHNGASGYSLTNQGIMTGPRSSFYTLTNFADILEDPATLMTYNTSSDYRTTKKEY